MNNARAAGLPCLLAIMLLSGCVERRYVITSDPPGAMVYMNGQPLGVTPVDAHFVYYGTYRFTLVKDGFETQHIDQKIVAPWYEIPPIDFVSENVYPGRLEDVRRFHYELKPLLLPRTDELLQQAEQLRSRGRNIAVESQVPPVAPPPGAVPNPAPTIPPPPATFPGAPQSIAPPPTNFPNAPQPIAPPPAIELSPPRLQPIAPPGG